MYRHITITSLVLTVLLLSGCEPSTNIEPSQPNILLIVLDDFGYNDLGANGNTKTPTPNLNELASQGIRYTRHYADATCSVARVALLTGTYPAVNGFRPARLGLSNDSPTIAKTLQQAGYRTQHIGKWHVGNATLAQSPQQAGFDDWFGFLTQFELKGLSKDGIHFGHPSYIKPWLQGGHSAAKQYPGHLTDILSDKAISFIKQQEQHTSPWFLNLWYFAPHDPPQPAARFKKKHPNTKEGRYYALIDQLDENVGKVLKALEDSGQANDTLVIVVSDNGGTNRFADNNFPYHGRKNQFLEGGLRTPLLMRWPGHISAGDLSDELVSLYDLYPTIAHASSSTTPAQLIGRNLLSDKLPPSPQLFWEYSTTAFHKYSVLSKNGRWRLSHDFVGEPILNDLKSDPSGENNTIEQHPDIAAELKKDYLQWRKESRQVKLDYRKHKERSGGIVYGNSLQRSPGYGAFTFVIGITPLAQQGNQPQVIAEQAKRWRLQHSTNNGLSLIMPNISINTPALTQNRCSEIVITGYYQFSPRKPEYNQAIVELYIDGQRIESSSVTRPPLNIQNYANPTYIGSNPLGGEQFSGKLSPPIILNEMLVPDNKADKIANGISGIPSTCQSI